MRDPQRLLKHFKLLAESGIDVPAVVDDVSAAVSTDEERQRSLAYALRRLMRTGTCPFPNLPLEVRNVSHAARPSLTHERGG